MPNNKAWGGRFAKSSSALLEEFNASIGFDKELYAQDIQGSLAHAKMLYEQGIIDSTDLEKIKQGLGEIKKEIEQGKFVFSIGDEDIHMAIEKRLVCIIGDAGKRLHTARSRNDQVALDMRLFVRQKTNDIAKAILDLERVLLDLAKENVQTLMPGMTHLQHAQPISFAYHILAYVSMFKRDYERLQSNLERNDYCPLGCAALAGTPHAIDRHMVAKDLGFFSPTINCLDTVSDRDFVLDLLYAISVFFMHSSRFCEELVLWSSSEFGFVQISDDFATGSSIMPQKKNPDVPELIRGKTGRVYGNLFSLLTTMKGLALAYNKDLQEDKEPLFDSVKTAQISIDILTAMLASIEVRTDNMQNACEKGHLSATDLADFLVLRGVAFRDAHFISAKAVELAHSKGLDLSQLDILDLKSIDPKCDEQVLEVINLWNSKNARKSYGATADEAVATQIDFFENWLKTERG